ncbi:SAF domain-containing protein [Acidiferrimicrobium sp. IK]|uniref:SAF domain-containing protein n=1 Tax=Acidiferrimicrobium sp. IK TaxID=2871700 RepID=UPI0021CB70C9|nr:SAF domain-containing protein [Acidiferrimicrobium sp. IK]MCU4185155.1 SAF domain-containing protein [Acidiferrimicrobium sp. IK]
MPLVVVGVLLVVGCALGFADASLSLASHQDVLAVAQPVAVGQVLTAGDLRSVRVSTGAGLAVVPAGEEAGVVGRPVAVPLVAGALLVPGDIGTVSPAASGADVVAVALKAGLFPPDLAQGDRVQIVPVVTSASSTPTVSGGPVDATVLGVQAAVASSNADTVFSLQVASSEADGMASLAAAGDASLVQVGAGS